MQPTVNVCKSSFSLTESLLISNFRSSMSSLSRINQTLFYTFSCFFIGLIYCSSLFPKVDEGLGVLGRRLVSYFPLSKVYRRKPTGFVFLTHLVQLPFHLKPAISRLMSTLTTHQRNRRLVNILSGYLRLQRSHLKFKNINKILSPASCNLSSPLIHVIDTVYFISGKSFIVRWPL
jgi:hypothetical protein